MLKSGPQCKYFYTIYDRGLISDKSGVSFAKRRALTVLSPQLTRAGLFRVVRSRSNGSGVAKMASHAIFQYNVLAIDDTHNTWTNMIVKINIPRLLGSSDDKEKIGVARPEGPPLQAFCYHRLNRRRAK